MEPRYGNNHALAESGGGGGNGVGGGNGGGDYYGGERDSGIDSRPGRGTRLLHREEAQSDTKPELLPNPAAQAHYRVLESLKG